MNKRWLETTTPSAPIKGCCAAFSLGRVHPSFARRGLLLSQQSSCERHWAGPQFCYFTGSNHRVIISVNVISPGDRPMGTRPSKTAPKAPETFLPLTPAVFHILLTLADGDAHGYAIMQDVARMSAGVVRLGPGTLYGAIGRLLEDMLIEECDERPVPEMDDTRR